MYRVDRVFSVSMVLLAALLILGVGCSSDNPTEPLGPEEELTAYIRANYELLATPSKIPYPDNNQPDDKRIALGRLVFFDPVLSGDGDVACATCHHPAFAWGDGIPVSIGVGGEGIGPDRVQTLPGEPTEFTTPRNSPTVLDAAFYKPFEGDEPWRGRMFWDGRASSLEEQARLPVRSRDEMRHDAYLAPEALTTVLEKLQGIDAYVTLFSEAFPDVAADLLDLYGPGFEHFVINGDTYSRVIAAYEREIVTADSPFDRFVKGDDSALTYSQKRGFDVFNRVGCIDCHDGPMFSDFEFHAIGVKQGGSGKPPVHETGDGTDLGRYLESGGALDRFAFRTPTLRNIALTGPYFHTGGEGTVDDYQTLMSVVEFHRRGGNDEGLAPEELDPDVRIIEMTDEEAADLVAFMESLTATRLASDRVDPTVPESVPSGLEPPPVLPPVLTNDFVSQESK